MDPPQLIKYENPYCLLLVNPNGRMKRLYTPFRVQVVEPIGTFQPETRVYVDQVAAHQQYLIIYKVASYWYPYHSFRLPVL